MKISEIRDQARTYPHSREDFALVCDISVLAIASKVGNLPIGIISVRESILGPFPPPRPAAQA